MDDKILKEQIKLIKESLVANVTAEMLQNVKLYCNEPGINKHDISGLLSKLTEELN